MTTEAPVAEVVGENVAAAVEATSPEVAEAAPIASPAEPEPAAPAATPAPERPSLAGLAPEEIEALPEVKDLLRRTEQSVKDRETAAANKRVDETHRRYINGGEYVSALTQAVDPDSGNLDQRKVTAVVQHLQTAADIEAAATVSDLIRAQLPSDAAIALADQQRLERAQGLDERVAISFEIAVNAKAAAQLDSERTAMRKEIERDVRREFEAKAETDRRRAAEATTATQPTPSRGTGGGGAKTFATQIEMDTARVNGTFSADEYRQARRDGSYDALPWQ